LSHCTESTDGHGYNISVAENASEEGLFDCHITDFGVWNVAANAGYEGAAYDYSIFIDSLRD
jgi:hypothetical protein